MENIKDKLRNPEYRNWVKSTLGLERTNRALYEYVKEKFVLFTHRRSFVQGPHFTEDIYKHIHPDSGCIRRNLIRKTKYSRKNNTWQWNYNCGKCGEAFKTILSLHMNATEELSRVLTLRSMTSGHTLIKFAPNFGHKNGVLLTSRTPGSGIYWQNCDDTSNVSLEWAIAKIFMPEGNERNTGPDDTDIAAMIILMLNCKLFTNPIRRGKLKALRKARNNLFHSPDDMVSNKEVMKYFDDMNRVLTDASNDNEVDKNIREIIVKDMEKIEKLKEAEMTMTLFDDALKLKRKAIYDDFEKCLSENDIEQLRILRKLAENVSADLRLMNDHKDELKNIKEQTNEIKRLQTKENHIKTELQNMYEITRHIKASHVEFRREVWNMLDKYRQFENSHINEIINRVREQVTPLSSDLNQLQQVPNGISVLTQGMMRLKMRACFCWQSVRDEVGRLDAEGLIIVVIITIGLTLLFRLYLFFT